MATLIIRRSRMQGSSAFMAKVEAAADAEGCEVACSHSDGNSRGVDVFMKLVGPDAGIDKLKSQEYLGLL